MPTRRVWRWARKGGDTWRGGRDGARVGAALGAAGALAMLLGGSQCLLPALQPATTTICIRRAGRRPRVQMHAHAWSTQMDACGQRARDREGAPARSHADASGRSGGARIEHSLVRYDARRSQACTLPEGEERDSHRDG